MEEKNSLFKKYIETRSQTVKLCEGLQPEDFSLQAAPFVSPPKWHLAHTSWFFEEMVLKQFSNDYKTYDDTYAFLFNSYYNSLGERIGRHERGLITRPTSAAIFTYRDYVDKHIEKLLESDFNTAVETLIILGINHEQQHQELLITDLKFSFSHNPTYPELSHTNFISDRNAKNTTDDSWIAIAEGIYTIGHQSKDFSFDNELGVHRVFLEPFKISKDLVTNGDYIKFLESGAYSDPKYWLDDGWAWINNNAISKPLYWKKIAGKWFHYTISGLKPIDKQAILSHVSFYEANAFAFWSGHRLPTEFEWEIASKQFVWGTRWEWTNSAYLPYPKFKISKGAVGEYNGKFMVNLMVLRGASTATAPNHSRNTYRNFFSPEMQWQLSGIRLVK